MCYTSSYTKSKTKAIILLKVTCQIKKKIKQSFTPGMQTFSKARNIKRQIMHDINENFNKDREIINLSKISQLKTLIKDVKIQMRVQKNKPIETKNF